MHVWGKDDQGPGRVNCKGRGPEVGPPAFSEQRGIRSLKWREGRGQDEVQEVEDRRPGRPLGKTWPLL